MSIEKVIFTKQLSAKNSYNNFQPQYKKQGFNTINQMDQIPESFEQNPSRELENSSVVQ